MRKYMESGFYIVYFVAIVTLGVLMMAKSKLKGKKYYILFGLACVLLGLGDSFHLAPRAVGLFTGTLDDPSATLDAWLGVGKLVTSVTMTAFYVLVYFFLFKRTGKKRPLALDIAVCVLTAARIVLCALPQNNWLTNDSPLLWGILRNIPFLLLGILVIVLCFRFLWKEKYLKLMGVAIVLSFGFYLPVVLFAAKASWVGMLMLPKTMCYLWIAAMAYVDEKKG